MTQAAFKAVYIDAKALRGLKVVRFMFDVAVEDSTEALTILGGFPRPDEPVYVGIAPIKEGATKAVSEAPRPASEPKTARKFNDLPFSQQAAIRCQDEAFRRFLRNDSEDMYLTADEAAQGIRNLCFVTSRADIKFGTEAGNRWLLIESAFQAWLREPEHVA